MNYMHVSHITFEKSRTLHDSKDNLKLFCFKGRSSTFRLFRFRFIPTFIFFTRFLSAGHFYARVLHELWTITLNVQNIHHWLTHMSAVACGSLLQRCQWLYPVRQTKLTIVHFKTRELVLVYVQLVLRLQHCSKPDNPVDWGRVNWGVSSYEIKSIGLIEMWNLKR